MGGGVGYEKLYLKLYKLFDGVTPIKKDCGDICGKACCSGGDRTGMLLFPHEKTKLQVIEADGKRLAVCGGNCERASRPLSCRIFPLFPAVSPRGGVVVRADLRGREMCPLARLSDEVAFDRRFVKNVKKAGRMLLRDAECEVFLKEVTAELDDISDMLSLLDMN